MAISRNELLSIVSPKGGNTASNTPSVSNVPSRDQLKTIVAGNYKPAPVVTQEAPKKSFSENINDFWNDVKTGGIGDALAKRILPKQIQQPENVVNQNVNTMVQRPIQDSALVERTGRNLVVSALDSLVVPMIDLTALLYESKLQSNKKIYKNRPEWEQDTLSTLQQGNQDFVDSLNRLSDRADQLSKDIAPKDQNALDTVVQAFGSTLAFFISGALTKSAKVPAILETLGNMGEVARNTRGMEIDNRIKRVSVNGALNGVYNYITNKFGISSKEQVGLKKLIQGFIAEGSQEGSQALLGNITSTEDWNNYWKKVVENAIQKKPLFSETRPFVEAMFRGVPESALVGGLMGSMFSLADLSGVAQDTTTQEEEKKEEPVTQTQTEMTPTEALQKSQEPFVNTPNLEQNLNAERNSTVQEVNTQLDNLIEQSNSTPVGEGKQRFYQLTGETGTNWLWGSTEELKKWAESSFSPGEQLKFVDLYPSDVTLQENGAYTTKEGIQTPEIIKTSAEPKIEPSTGLNREVNMPVGEGRTKNSRLYERMTEQLLSSDPTRYGLNENTGTYNQLNLKDDAQKALDFLEKNPAEAIAVSLGLKEAPQGQTTTGISIATALKAREENNYKLYSEIMNSTSMRLTRAGQEIVSVRGQFTDDSPENFIKRLIDSRMRTLAGNLVSSVESIGKKMGLDTVKSKVIEKIDSETKKLKERLKKDQKKIQLAQDIIDAMRC